MPEPGELAATAGLAVFAATQDANQGASNDNTRGDELADHMLNGGHHVDKLTGVLPVAKGGTGGATPAAARTALGIVAGAIPTTGSNVQADIDYVNGRASAALAGVADHDADIAYIYDGNLAPAVFSRQVGGNSVYISSTGRLGHLPSARRFKRDISPAELDVDELLERVVPVTYRLRTDADDAPLQLGFIADELVDVLPEVVVFDAEGAPMSLHYAGFVPALQAIARELARRLEQLTARVAVLEQTNTNTEGA